MSNWCQNILKTSIQECLISQSPRQYMGLNYNLNYVVPKINIITSSPEGVARYCFHPVCLSVYVCVCLYVCPANILVFYFSAIRRDIDLKCIQDTYRVVLNSLKKINLHRSKVKVTGTVHCFLKVQSYHKN